MKKILLYLVPLLLLLGIISCEKVKPIENINLNYNTQLVTEKVEEIKNCHFAKLKGWSELDSEANPALDDLFLPEEKYNSIYFYSNTDKSGLIIITSYSSVIEAQLRELEATADLENLISQEKFNFNDKNYYQYMFKKDGFIILSVLVDLGNRSSIKLDYTIKEDKYSEHAKEIETLLASLSLFN
ncbi:MAG: hypothetical protein B6226_02240 [Candidatus Cloacimonetes bacterium 4572_65]|nr:MAG: hypothetical protein B6226_02240 [Candidatus Cloacimonetes bacterium 4572_65]